MWQNYKKICLLEIKRAPLIFASSGGNVSHDNIKETSLTKEKMCAGVGREGKRQNES